MHSKVVVFIVCTYLASLGADHSPSLVQKNAVLDLHDNSQQQQQQQRGPPAVLKFDAPANGSVVSGTDIDVAFSLRAGRTSRALTQEEVQAFQDAGATMCFEISGPSEQPRVCSPLRLTTLTIDRPLPGTWHTVSASIETSISTTITQPASPESFFEGLGVTNAAETVVGDELLRRNGGVEGVWDGAGDSVTLFVAIEGISSRMCGDSACLDDTRERSAYFDRIYSDKRWGATHSGPGSTLSATTQIRAGLEDVLRSYSVTSMLDVPCGDLTWIRHVQGIEDVLYTGADISAQVVESNRRVFPTSSDSIGPREGVKSGQTFPASTFIRRRRRPGFQGAVFVQADLVNGVPPSPDGTAYDLIFLRDLMLHLPTRQNLQILRNVDESGARLLMASTFVDADDNWRADTFIPAFGHFINLALPPYCLRPPIALYLDASTRRGDQRMGLWAIDPARPLSARDGSCGQNT